MQVSTTEDYKIDFMEFPPEIRNEIYGLVFVKPTYIGSASGSHVYRTQDFHKDARAWRNLGFVMSCRSIYQESANIFYIKNGFEFYYNRPFLEFLQALGVQRRALLTKLRYHQLENGRPFIVCRYLKSCTGLKDLEIFVRFITQKRASYCWEYPLKDPKEFFLGNKTTIEFEAPLTLGNPQSGFGPPIIYGCGPFKLPRPNSINCFEDLVCLSLNNFSGSLENVKKEEQGMIDW